MATVASTPPTATPPPAEVKKWAQLAVALIIIGFGLSLITVAIIIDQKLLTTKFDLLLGWFMGLLSSASLYLGFKQLEKGS